MVALEVEMHEISDLAIRTMLRQATSVNADGLGDACGGGCGRGASCSTRCEEMEAMLCGAD